MNTLFLAVIPLITAFLGYVLSLKYGESKEFWEKFDFWHEKFKSEINFSLNPLPEILRSSKKQDVFSKIVTEFFNSGNLKCELNFLSEDEKAFLSKYLQNLGGTDKNSQLGILNSMESELKKYVEKSEDNSKKYRPLFIKLGFLVGLIIFILVV